MRTTGTWKGRGTGRRVAKPVAVSLSAAALLALVASCSNQSKPTEPRVPREVDMPPYLKDTVGELARIAGREYIPVQAYGFVTGLDGTGTKVVPPGVRQHILDMMRRRRVDGAEEVLASADTAVVMVSGVLPPGINKGEVFDVDVRALPNTETTSLEGGIVLETDLTRVASARGVDLRSEPMAVGRGSIFVSPFGTDEKASGANDPRVGRILAGGRAIKSREFRLALLTPSVRSADQIVRVINARFSGAAQGTRDAGRIDLTVPKEYQEDKAHFLDLVLSLYLRETPDGRDQRLSLLLEYLQGGKDMGNVALCLEAFGLTVAPRLRTLRDHPDEAVRFHVGRTLAHLQEAEAVYILERIATSPASDFQEMAVEALGRIRSGVGLGVIARALDAPSARVRVAAWRAMIRLTPQTFVLRVFEDKFVLSAVATRAEPFVYVARTLTPHLAVFGDVVIRPPVLAETRRVTASAVAGAREVTLITRRHGRDVRVTAPLDVVGLVAKLAAPLEGTDKDPRPQGLGLGYSDCIGVLHEMTRRQALSGPLVLQPLDYRIPGDRPIAQPIRAAPGAEEKGPPGAPGGRDAPSPKGN